MKQEKYDMNKLIKNKPKYTIDHILKERYPRFLDAINDLDDALCLINLFSNLPKHELLNIKSDTVSLCQRLIKEFNLYCAITQTFKKGFISIKGIYLNTEIMGQPITWLSPFNHPLKLTFEVDYEIMSNFLELYTNLMKFVNLKLFKDIGLEYSPPQENSDLPFFGFTSLDIRSLQDKINSKSSKDSENVRIFDLFYF
jgi:pescadillo protein